MPSDTIPPEEPPMYHGTRIVGLAALLAAICLTGCTSSESKPKGMKPAELAAKYSSIPDEVAKLDPEDRKLAEAQRWCAVNTDKPLGSMGKPYKVMVKDQPVFLCCEHC